MTIRILLLVFVIIIFVPDLFLPRLIKHLKKDLGQIEENDEWSNYSKILGRIERCLYGIFLLFIPAQFSIFVGIWLALKVVGSFNTWQPDFKERDASETYSVLVASPNHKSSFEYHRRRARHIIFTIGTGLSLLWVVIICLIVSHTLLSPINNPFNV